MIRALCGLVLLIAGCAVQALPAFPLPVGAAVPVQRILDPQGQWTIDEVAGLAQHRWTLLKGPLSEGYTRSVVWLRIELQPQSQSISEPQSQPGEAVTLGQRLWLEVGPTYLDHVDVYQRTGAHWSVQHDGDMVPLSQRRAARPILFSIDPHQPVWVRVATTSAMQFHAVLHDDQSLHNALMAQSSEMGAIAGAMACFIVALVIAGWRLRSRPMLALALLGLVALLHSLGTRGYVAPWVPDAWPSLASDLVGLGAFALAASCAWLAREQLTRATEWVALDRMLLALVVMDVACMLSIPLNLYDRVAWLGVVSPVISGVTGLWLCVRQRRDRFMRLLGIGYAVHSTSGMLIALAFLGVLALPFHAGGIWSLQMAFFGVAHVAAILFGVVRAFQQGQQEREQALHALQASERELEQRVVERTHALQASQQTLGHVLEEERLMRVEQRHFFNMVSHEFRTPLAIVDSAATAQLSFPSADLQEQQARAAQIRRACRRLTSLVDNCLISDRMDASGFRLLPSLVDVRAMLEEATQLVLWSSKHRLQLFLNAAPDQWPCDATLVRIAISNLVDNAVKYAAPGDIFVAARKADSGLLEISVADSGPGMSLEARHKVFQLFERGARADETRGFGLGLWVTQRIARQHGGDVILESELGRSTCFTLQLAPQLLGDGHKLPAVGQSV